MLVRVALLAGCGLAAACAGSDPFSALAPTTTTAETAIHIFSLAPRAGSTLDYDGAMRVTGHYTFSAQDSARRGTAAMWLCLGVDRDTFITGSCSGGHRSATDEFNETTTVTPNAVSPRAGGFDTQFAHLLLVDGPLVEDGLPPSATGRIREVKGVVLTGLTFPHAIHWK